MPCFAVNRNNAWDKYIYKTNFLKFVSKNIYQNKAEYRKF